MSYLVSKLVVDAYHIAGVVPLEMASTSPDEITRGFNYLNEDVLPGITLDEGMIPYYQEYNLDAVIGQSTYFIENLVSIDTFVFFIDTVRYESTMQQRREFWGTSRAVDIQSLPFKWNFQRTLNGGNLNVYFQPDQTYPMQIWGIFRLSAFTSLYQDISTSLDDFYIAYLKYKLAAEICFQQNLAFPPNLQQRLIEYRRLMNRQYQQADFRTSYVSTLNRGGIGTNGINYPLIGLGRGYTPC